MSTTLKIKVTKEILERSKMCGFGKKAEVFKYCAVVEAVHDLWPDASVGGSGTIYIYGDKYAIRTPSHVYEFIRKFDRSTPDERTQMPPIEFEIEISDEVLERISIDEIKPLLVNHPTLELV